MAAVAAELPSGLSPTYQAHRTEAMPKNTLFGTALELTKEEEQQDIMKMVQAEHNINKKCQPENGLLVSKRDALERQKEMVRQKLENLRSVTEKALTFDPEPRTVRQEPRTRRDPNKRVDKTHQWFTTKDLDHAKEINKGGFTTSGSYNRDRYTKRMPIITYGQIKDVIYPPEYMRTSARDDNNNNSDSKSQLRTNLTNDKEMPQLQNRATPHSVVDLPRNIRHRFGSKVCDELLSDETKVAASIERYERTRFPPRRRGPGDLLEIKVGGTRGYDPLSRATRQNIFPGHSTDNQQSLMKSVYTDDVFRSRHPDPDEFRYQRDQLSKWAEHNVLRERMKKAWELKLQAAEKS